MGCNKRTAGISAGVIGVTRRVIMALSLAILRVNMVTDWILGDSVGKGVNEVMADRF